MRWREILPRYVGRDWKKRENRERYGYRIEYINFERRHEE